MMNGNQQLKFVALSPPDSRQFTFSNEIYSSSSRTTIIKHNFMRLFEFRWWVTMVTVESGVKSIECNCNYVVGWFAFCEILCDVGLTRRRLVANITSVQEKGWVKQERWKKEFKTLPTRIWLADSHQQEEKVRIVKKRARPDAILIMTVRELRWDDSWDGGFRIDCIQNTEDPKKMRAFDIS